LSSLARGVDTWTLWIRNAREGASLRVLTRRSSGLFDLVTENLRLLFWLAMLEGRTRLL